jgi:hypothetical protein
VNRGGSQRILPIDATRGMVMLFSCLAHFAWWIHPVYPDASATLSGIGMVATPTFLLLSGAMVGMLCATPRKTDLRSQLFNRGLFLLTVGHVLIALAESHLSGGFRQTLRGVTVVDEIGLCTLAAAFLLPRLASQAFCVRLAQAASLVLVLAWLGNVLWLPDEDPAVALENLVIGGNVTAPNFTAHSPILQHLAIYAIGLPLGHYFASFARQRVSLAEVASRLLWLGAMLIVAAFALRAFRFVLDDLLALHSQAVDLTLKVTEKTPPSPAYLLFFGGCGLALAGTMFHLSAFPSRWVKSSLEWVAVIGRASLFVFVLQYFLYWTLPDLLRIEPNAFCALMFVGNVLLIRYAAGWWGRLKGNRWLTFGIRLGSPPPQRS